MKKSMLLGEIKFYLEKLRKKYGLYIVENDGKVIYYLRIYYTNVDFQRRLVNDLLKKYNISKRHYGFFKYLLSDYVRIDVYEIYISKKIRTLEKVRDDLKRIYDNFNESIYLDKLEKEINNIFENDLWIMNKHIDDMNKIRELEKQYLEFLDKKRDYDSIIKQFEEEIINNYAVKYNYRITKIIKDRIRKIINDKFSLIWVQYGFALIIVYQNKHFENENKTWVYENNKFYLIDLRNNKIFDVSEKVNNFEKEKLTEKAISHNLYGLKWLKLEDLLI